MRIKVGLFFAWSLGVTPMANGQTHSAHDMAREHGGGIFSRYVVEAQAGAGPHGKVAGWDLDGWTGSDDHKVWIKSDGEFERGRWEEGELWVLYSRNVATFWDAQAGLRHEIGPHAETRLALGITGLAPYYFETEAHLFIGRDGIAGGRLRSERDWLLTQRMIVQPFAELEIAARDDAARELGAGLSEAAFGLQLRYEFIRTFAPYMEIRHERKLGETSAMARAAGEDINQTTGALGLRLMF